MTNPLNEKYLVEKWIAGDNMGERLLYELFSESMIVVCRIYIRDEDHARESMLKGIKTCFKKMKDFQYRGEGSLETWVRKVTVDTCLNYLK